MNIWKIFLSAFFILIFSGCNSRTQNIQLRNINKHQAHTIKQQKLLIDAFRTKYENRSDYPSSSGDVIQAPKKNVVLKKVEDDNYSSGYMYPKTNPRKVPSSKKDITVSATQVAMTKEECIGMIGAEKFAKYTQMFGSEASSLKRCTILKAMKN